MSGRIFQNVVLQLKENTDRTVGVIDGEGIVIACSELAMIGQRWAEHVPAINAAGGAIVTSEGKTFKALNGWGTQFDYAAFAFGDNEISKTVCAMATVALNAAKSYYEEKHDRGSFIKDIISDNIMLGDIYVRAKELRVTADVPRGVFVVRTLKKGESVPTDVIQSLFPDRQNDFVLSIGEGDVVLIRQMPEGSGIKELNKIASSIEEALRAGGEPTVVVGIGTVATDFTAPVIPGYSKDLKGSDNLKYNPTKAKELWAKADAISKYDGKLTFSFNADGGAQPIYEAVVNQVNNTLGIQASINPMPTFQEFRDAISNRTIKGAFRTAWQPDYPSAENYLYQLYDTAAANGHGSNDGDYSNKDVDKLLDQAASATDQETAIKYYHDAEEILLEQLPAFPLYYSNADGVAAKGVKNFQMDWQNQPIYEEMSK